MHNCWACLVYSSVLFLVRLDYLRQPKLGFHVQQYNSLCTSTFFSDLPPANFDSSPQPLHRQDYLSFINLWLMENSGSSSLLRYRRLGSFLDTSSGATAKGTSKVSEKDIGQKSRQEVDVNEDGLGSKLISCVRIVMCFVMMTVTTLTWALIMFVLLPWPYERIRQGNVYGHVTGRLMMWILGNPVKIEGAEFANERAIFISNHASPLDIFPIMWLIPTGTVAIGKKEVIWYPLFGQLYVLANHLRIDRSNPTAAIDSLKEAAQTVVRKKLSLILFPEGTRSADGRLLRLKKGFVHLALQTGLPIVPIVLIGTHRACTKGSLRVRPTPLTIKYLPPIRTDDWTADKIDEYIKLIHDLYVQWRIQDLESGWA